MSAVLGPFQPDRNLSVASLAFEDRLWVLLRPFPAASSGAADVVGVLELHGVRCSRARSISDAELTELLDDADPSFWALAIEHSAYLEDSLDDPRNPVRDPERYRHFVVTNGWHRVIDVVATSARCHVRDATTALSLGELVGGANDPLKAGS